MLIFTFSQVNGIREGEDPEAKKRSLMDKMKGMRDGLSDRIPQQHKDKASDQFDRGKKFLTEEYFPEERRDQFIYRGKKVRLDVFYTVIVRQYFVYRSLSSARSTTTTRSLSSGFFLMLKNTLAMVRRSLIRAKIVTPLSPPYVFTCTSPA
jgi:hypothetical protein